VRDMIEDELDIPESNREIALHLRAIKLRLDNLEGSVSSFQDSMEQRRFKLQDVLLSSLLFPLVGGMLLFLLTQALGQ
jgi:hypothetical protein